MADFAKQPIPTINTATMIILFNIKKLDSISCEILNTNSRSARFTLSLGYQELDKNNILTTYFLTKVAFLPYFEKISKMVIKILCYVICCMECNENSGACRIKRKKMKDF